LSYEQISGASKYKLLLTEAQKEKLNKKLEKGFILELNYDQLKANHTGGFLPIYVAALGALGRLAWGASAVTNAVISAKHQSAEEKKLKRHNSEMEKIAKSKQVLSLTGSGLKRSGVKAGVRTGVKTKTMAWSSVKKDKIEPLSHFDILKLVKNPKIKDFRGVFMKEELPLKVKKTECGVINLQNTNEEGSHWTAYYKNNY